MSTKSDVFSVRVKSPLTFKRANRHSKRVRLWKLLLPILAIFIGIVFSWYTFFATPSSSEYVVINDVQNPDGRLTMTDPILEGYTSDNQPYSVTAAKAIQYPSRSGIIALENIYAKIPMGQTNVANITAQSGEFDNINGRLQLNNPFNVETNAGMVAKFQDADINLNTNHLITNKAVDIRQQDLHLKANNLQIKNNGEVLLFGGGVRLVIDHGNQANQ